MNCRSSRSQIANSTAGPGPNCLSPVLWCRFPWDLLLFFFADEKVLFVYSRRDRNVEKSHHHFVIGLFAPAHFGIRIRIVQVRFGIVVPRDRLKFCSRFQVTRHRQLVAHLPVEMIVDAKQRLNFILWPAICTGIFANQVVFESFSTQVHMREKTEQRGVIGNRAARLDAVVRRAWWYHEMIVGELQRQHLLLGTMLRKNQSNARLFGCRSEEHTSELQSHLNLVCRLLLEKKNKINNER